MKKKIVIFSFVVLIAGLVFFFLIKNEEEYIQTEYIKDILLEQEEVDKELKKISKDKTYNIEEPYIIVNPYKISPLSGLIIFNTKEEESYELIINNEVIGNTEKSKKHMIPVYGLLKDYENKVVLKNGDSTYEYTLTTEDVSVGKMDITKSSKKLNDELYFLVGGQNPTNVAYDYEGNVRWYLDLDLAIDIDFLDNGHLLIGNGEGSSYVGFTGLLEIDYLGKIYKEYILSGGTHHSIQVMPNGNYLIPTGSSSDEVSWDYVVEIDSKTGKNVKEIDLVEIFRSIDSEFVDSIKEGSTYAYNNSAYYDKESNTLTLSLRKLNSVINIDYETLELNFIYGEKEYWSDAFDEYFIDRLDNSRETYGQHSVFFENNTFGLFDNHILDVYEEKCSVLLKTYSSAELFQITDKGFKNIFSFNGNKKYFSPYLSSFSKMENGNYLVNFGYVIDMEEFKKVNCDLDFYLKGPLVKLFELDKDGNILLEASFDGQAKQFIYKNKLYSENINNLSLDKFEQLTNY